MTAVLFTCAGQRVDIVTAFGRAGATTIACDLDRLAPALYHADRLVLITSRGHRAVRGPNDVADSSVIAFPAGCAYRRRLYRWLGEGSLATTRVLDLASYHAIVTCVGSGTGIALMPESVLDTLPLAQVQRHRLPREYAQVVTPLIWRTQEQSRALVALRELLERSRKPPRRAL